MIDLATARRERDSVAPLSTGAIWQAIQEQRVLNTYQGQFNLAAGQMISAEALVRLVDYDGSLILPNRFIDIAEASQVMVPLGWEVITRACRDLTQARARGLALEQIAVNLSVRQIASDPSLETFVTATLKHFNLVSADLAFELTERLALDEDSEAAAALYDLVSQGTRVVSDDIGIGYALLDFIQRLPISGFKLDRTLIARLSICPTTECLTRHLIAIAD